MPALSRRQTAGIVAACASSMLGGTAVVVTRILVEQVDPLTLAALRYGLGAACLLPLVLLARRRLPDRRDLLPIAGLGFIFFALFVWLFNTALGWTTASHGALALSTMPFLTLIVVSLFRAEPMRLVKLMGVLCAATGVAVALSGKADGTPPGAWRGDLMMVGAAGCGALYNVLSQPYLRRYPALPFTGFAMLAGSLAMLLLAYSASPEQRSPSTSGVSPWSGSRPPVWRSPSPSIP